MRHAEDRGFPAEITMATDPSPLSAAERARWLSQLSDALDEAQALLGSLAGDCIHRAGELDLFDQLAAVRGQLYRLRCARADEEIAPDRTIPAPWPTGERKPR